MNDDHTFAPEMTAEEAIQMVLKWPEMYGLQKVATVPDAATEAKANAKIADLVYENASLKAERDAALAAVERVRAAKFEVDSVHQIHGTDCLCGFSSARSRSRTEHITEAMVAALDGGDSGE